MNLKSLFRVSLLIVALLFVAVINSFAQGVIIDTATNTVTLPPISFPKDGNTAWYYSKEGMAGLIGILTVLAHYLANLIPGFRKLKLDAPLKAIAIGMWLSII